MTKHVPFTKEQIEKLALEYPTPFYIYDEKAIRLQARRFYKAFSWVPNNFYNYFAVKALPNPHIMKILKEEGMGADCSSLPELLLAEKIGLKGDQIMFTSNDTPAEEFVKAKQMDAIINLDDFTHIDFLEKNAGLADKISFRYNPGPLKAGNDFIGNPVEAKYGMTKQQLLEAYSLLKEKGVQRFGLHTMVASNEINPDYFAETAILIFDLALEVLNRTGIVLDFINLGGGIGIPYKPEQDPVDLEYLSSRISKIYQEKFSSSPLAKTRIVMECGRMVTGPYGYLVSRVRHIKKTYKRYAGLDACMANLMRPAIYGAYHHISLLGNENRDKIKQDVTGSLCENNDKFAIDRLLPELKPDDIVVIHDGGAHAHAMGFNYNGKLRSAEFLLKENNQFKQIRRAETIDDYFATLEFE